MNLNKTLKLKSILMFFDNVYLTALPTPRLSIKPAPLSYWCKNYLNGLGSYLATLSYGQQNLAGRCLAF